MVYTARMQRERFEALAVELAERDRGLDQLLARVRDGALELRARAEAAMDAFRVKATAAGAEHLTQFELGPVEPDEKHVDCLQFRVSRGRWEIICVAKAAAPEPKVTLVGPFRRGKPERPCSDHPLTGKGVERALEDLLLVLIREASER